MARFQLPLSGNVSQTINPWTWVFSPTGGQFGLLNLNIDLGPSSNPDIEAEVVRDVASYGKQIGRMADVISVLIDGLDVDKLPRKQQKAIADFQTLLEDVDAIKARHKGK